MNKSDNIDLIATALSKAQGIMTAAKKSGRNSFFKDSPHSTLEDIWDVIRGPLFIHGLAVTQGTRIDQNFGTVLVTMLMHTSGQWITSECKLLTKDESAQGLKSANTLLRRAALESMCGVPGEDDDGEASMKRTNNAIGISITGPPLPNQVENVFDEVLSRVQCDHKWMMDKFDTSKEYCTKCKTKRNKTA